MGKSTHFLGQPLYGQVIKLLDKAEILEISRKNGGERYIKRFDAWTHLMTMLYAVIMRHDSLREISESMLAEARKLEERAEARILRISCRPRPMWETARDGSGVNSGPPLRYFSKYCW